MRARLHDMVRRGLRLSLLIGLIAAALPAANVQATPYTEPTVVAADGVTATITAIDPPSRTAGLLALYTPAFGPTTKTNQFGAEAVLVKTDQPNQYRVIDVCTVWDTLVTPPRCSNPGNNPIPENGIVLSAAPGGSPDVRLFIRDHIKKDDLVAIYIPVRRTASRALDVIDPTAATNPDGIDPNTGQCYPGCRGAEQFILYTAAFGARTGTNEFGYEVTVVDGRVVAQGGNNSAIPADGFVLSGHGTVGSWLAANTILGASVTVDELMVTITIDPSAYMFTAQVEIDEAQAALTTARETCIDAPYAAAQAALDQARALLVQARATFEQGDDQGTVDLATAAQQQAQIALFRTIEARPAEGRGIWARPVEATRAAIAATVEQIAQAGFNLIYLETFFNGYTIYPSATAASYGVAAQSPQFVGIDVLQAWIEEAHARDIQLHAWVENFFVGNDAVEGMGPILSVHPDWAAVERSDVGKPGPQPSDAERGYYFLDPAIPEARQYLFDIYAEMLREYELDGLHLDYIRYPISLPLERSFSYSDYSRQAFQAAYGVDPYTITPDDNPDEWAQWVAWRQGNITSYVSQVRELIDTTRPAAALSAAVFPNQFDSQIRKMQNWEDWVQRGWMDFLAGMSFGRSANAVAADTAAMRAIVENQTLIYTGIYAPFLSLPPKTLVEQVEGVRDKGGHGISAFAWNQVSAGHSAALAEGPYRTPAVTPHTNPALAVATGLRDVQRRVSAVYVPGGCMEAKAAPFVHRALDIAVRALEQHSARPIQNEAALRRALDQLQNGKSLLDRSVQRQLIDPALAERLQAEFDLYESILDYALAQH